MIFSRLRPGKIVAVSLSACAVALIAGLTLYIVARLGQNTHDLRDQPFALAAALLEAHTHADRLHGLMMRAGHATDAIEAHALLRAAETTSEQLSTSLTQVVHGQRNNPHSLTSLFRANAEWTELRNTLLDLVRQNRLPEMRSMIDERCEPAYARVKDSFATILETERNHAAAMRDETAQTFREAVAATIALAVAGGGGIAFVLLYSALTLRAHRPLMQLRSRLMALASGQQGVDIPHCDRAGIVGEIARAVQSFKDSVAERDAAIAAAKHADEAKSRFLAAASHDLRQPLQALRLYLDTLDQRIHSRNERRILNGALDSLKAAEDLLRNYLDVSVMDSGILTPRFETVHMADLLDELVGEYAPQAWEKNLRLRRVGGDCLVRTDGELLRRLLRNLVGNAILYTEKGGVVVGCRRRGRSVRIEIWDSGIGIPENKLAAVFEDFYQLGNPERDRAKGLGLGLSVVDRVSRLLGHEVSVASRPGHGSVFTVTLPLAAQAKPVKKAKAA